jgi:Uma2 family endonuclease
VRRRSRGRFVGIAGDDWGDNVSDRPLAETGAIPDLELMQLPDDGTKYELVDGELVVSPACGRHEAACVKLAAAMMLFVRTQKRKSRPEGRGPLASRPRQEDSRQGR